MITRPKIAAFIVAMLMLLVIATSCISQKGTKFKDNTKKELAHYLVKENFKDYFLFQNAIGSLYNLDSNTFYQSVLVIWDNGFYAVGKIKQNYPIGSWLVFDKKSRLRKYVGYANYIQSQPVVKEYNKKGELISVRPSAISF